MNRGRRIILIVAVILALIPVPMTCGHMFYGCATGPDMSGNYYTYYEVEPLGITLIETLIMTNLKIYYWSGKEAHFIGIP
ncbi:MAG TPA: hypothetical protein PLD33_04855 [Anaerolineales bacterium]|nr:hypothetical protein [Anaerolineales bacterium]HMZ42091.1 hypothetical protein [Anaerolineales bacterium]HNA53621.1 hypothetical protein [Anaerolineales bacterium]HNC88352.1 hypothetical protein [Anaerolineales bacterium]HND90838.1 hypothetical protein [Anaerolineales bacterium]